MFHSGWHQHRIRVILTELRADILAVTPHAEPLVNMSSLTNVNVLSKCVCMCVCFLTGTFRDDGGRQRLRQLSVHRKHNQPAGPGVSDALRAADGPRCAQFTHTDTRTHATFPGLFGHVGQSEASMSSQMKCTFEKMK